MRSRSFHTELDFDDLDGNGIVERTETDRKQYSRGRSAQTPRRRVAKAASGKVPLGISARRNRRWAW